MDLFGATVPRQEWPWCLELLQMLHLRRAADVAAFTATILACGKAIGLTQRFGNHKNPMVNSQTHWIHGFSCSQVDMSQLFFEQQKTDDDPFGVDTPNSNTTRRKSQEKGKPRRAHLVYIMDYNGISHIMVRIYHGINRGNLLSFIPPNAVQPGHPRCRDRGRELQSAKCF